MRISIAGGGRAAWTFGRLVQSAGLELEGLVTRAGSSSTCADALAVPRLRWDQVAGSDAVIIAVADGALDEVSAAALSHTTEKTLLIHVSGARDSSIFGSRHGASLHPLAALPAPGEEPDLAGSAFVFEGSAAARELAQELAGAAGAVFVEIESTNKALYHTAAVFGSNFVATLAHVSGELMTTAGAALPREVIAALARSAIAGWERNGVSGLTGPAVRRDLPTIAANLESLGSGPDLDLYRLLSIRLLEIAPAAHGNEDKTEAIVELLRSVPIR